MTTQTDEQAAQAAKEREAMQQAAPASPEEIFAVCSLTALIVAAVLMILARMP